MKTKVTQSQKQESFKLINLYQESEQERSREELKLQVDQASVQLQVDTLATQQALLTAKAAYSAALRSKPFSPSNIIAAKNKIRSLEAGLDDLAELAMMF